MGLTDNNTKYIVCLFLLRQRYSGLDQLNYINRMKTLSVDHITINTIFLTVHVMSILLKHQQLHKKLLSYRCKYHSKIAIVSPIFLFFSDNCICTGCNKQLMHLQICTFRCSAFYSVSPSVCFSSLFILLSVCPFVCFSIWMVFLTPWG